MLDAPSESASGAARGYVPIGDYAAIGDGRTVALVARDGSIDWLCLPDLDSPSVFAAVLDADRGGRFALRPEIPARTERRYLPDTNVLETTFTTAHGVVQVTDAMALPSSDLGPTRELIRRVDCLAGRVPMRWRITPAFGYGAVPPRIGRRGRIPVAVGGRDALAVCSWEAGEAQIDDEAIFGRFEARESSSALIALCAAHQEPLVFPTREQVERRLDATVAYWRRWATQRAYEGPWRDAVIRSALALKLLVYAPSGAIAAAASASLPEEIGGERAPERMLELDGYRGSRPVRVGNDAAAQTQLDIYGDLLQTALIYAEAGGRFDRETGRRLAGIADLVCRIWRQPDSGIWEVRSQPVHFTHSKMMCWVALDRAIRLSDAGHIPSRHASTWRREMLAIREFIEMCCWSERLGSYSRHAGGEELDASLLLGILLGYEGQDPGRLAATVDALRRELGRGPLLSRYSGDDGLRGAEGAFLCCSFWLADALARVGRLDEATELMAELIALANDVGLYAEEIESHTNDLLGNIPQGLVHLALVNAAVSIARASSP
jgi:GH15 family glucan-1,4-alpha-glucosidase